MRGLNSNFVYKKPSIDPGPVITAPTLVKILYFLLHPIKLAHSDSDS